MKAISVRQPWAWLIVNGYKDIENRNWHTSFRGTVLIHAAKGMTRDGYEDCRHYAAQQGVTVPAYGDLERGGIVGQATITDCVRRSDSRWFFGKFGFVLADQKALPFRPLRGRLSFFDVPSEVLQ